MSTKKISKKNKTVALILAIFLGPYGAHQFYVGKIGKGILYLFTAGLCGIGWIVDVVRISTNKFTDNQGLFLVGEKKVMKENTENTTVSSSYPEHKSNKTTEQFVEINKTCDEIETQSKENTVIKESIKFEHNIFETHTATETKDTNTAKEIKVYSSKHIIPFFYSEDDILCYRYDDEITVDSSLIEHIKDNINKKIELKLSDEEDTVAVYLSEQFLGYIVNRVRKSVLRQWTDSKMPFNAYIDKLSIENNSLKIMSGFYRNLKEYKEKEFFIKRLNEEQKDWLECKNEGEPIHIISDEDNYGTEQYIIVDQYGYELANAPKPAVNFVDEDENYSYGYITEIFKNDEYEVSGFSFIIYTRK